MELPRFGPVAGADPVHRVPLVETGPSANEVDGSNPLRAERLAAIRTMIDGGTYETTERLEVALSRFVAAACGHS